MPGLNLKEVLQYCISITSVLVGETMADLDRCMFAIVTGDRATNDDAAMGGCIIKSSFQCLPTHIVVVNVDGPFFLEHLMRSCQRERSVTYDKKT